MPLSSRLVSRPLDRLRASSADGPEAGTDWTSSPFAMPGFFLGWVAVGVLLALLLVTRGHDARTMILLGAGLGPLMGVVVFDAIHRRDPAATAVLLEAGVDHGGPVDVLVLLAGGPEDVRVVTPALESTLPELGTLTLARPVSYEAVEADADGAEIASSRDLLAAAASTLPVRGAALAVWPGTVAQIADRFRRERPRGLLLVAGHGSTLDAVSRS